MSKGFAVWFTGLSGSGKTTLGRLLEKELVTRGMRVQSLDGDVLRQGLNSDLGFGKADRDENIRRVTYLAQFLSQNGVATLVSFISPFAAARQKARELIPNFIEVFVDCPLEVCIERDVKGLYKKALAGDINDFTGISHPYEEPEEPEIKVRTDLNTPSQCVKAIISELASRGFQGFACTEVAATVSQALDPVYPAEELVVGLPGSLYSKLAVACKSSNPADVAAYTTRVLRDHLQDLSGADPLSDISEAEKEAIKKRLRSFGYID